MTDVLPLIAATVKRPREVAAYLKSLQVGPETAWMALGAAVCLSVLLVFGVNGGVPVPLFENADPFGPWMMAIFVFSTAVILVFGLFWTGRAMGGSGTLSQTVMIMAWLQMLQFAGQLVQVIAALLVPPMAGIIGLAVLGFLVFVLLNFLDVLHDLGSLGKAAFLLLLALVGVSLGLTLLLGLVGVSAPGGMA